MAESLRDDLHFPSGARLPPAMLQNMKILHNKKK
jgi:hypothetical protein